MIRLCFNWQRATDKAGFIYFLLFILSLTVEDPPVQIDQWIKDASFKPSWNCIESFVLLLELPSGFWKRTVVSQCWDRPSLVCAVSVTLVFWADTSLFHQSRTSGPPGAVLKCHTEPPTEWCQPCVGLHHQILKHLSVIRVSLPTVMPMGHSLVVPFKKCYIMVKQVITIQTGLPALNIFWFANKHQFLIPQLEQRAY